MVAPDIHSFKGIGQPLTTSERTFFEPRFGRDFNNVRVHTDNRAARTAQTINARAFTLGSDVVFGAGQYAPGSRSGRSLLAHELTHVVQQSGKPTDGKSMLKQHFLHDSSLAIRRKVLSSSISESINRGIDVIMRLLYGKKEQECYENCDKQLERCTSGGGSSQACVSQYGACMRSCKRKK